MRVNKPPVTRIRRATMGTGHRTRDSAPSKLGASEEYTGRMGLSGNRLKDRPVAVFCPECHGSQALVKADGRFVPTCATCGGQGQIAGSAPVVTLSFGLVNPAATR